jgi:hypothetical protein
VHTTEVNDAPGREKIVWKVFKRNERALRGGKHYSKVFGYSNQVIASL